MIRFKENQMRKRLLLLFLSAPYLLGSSEVRQQVLTRDSSFKPVLTEVILDHLKTPDSYDGFHFRIVEGKSETPLPINTARPAIALKAATVYYHLTRARNFWIRTLDSEVVKHLPPLTIRLEITNGFSDLAHFQHESIDPQFNNALSIPAGTPFRGSSASAWGPEIWFRPMKRLRPMDLPQVSSPKEPNPLQLLAESLSGTLRLTQFSRMVQTALEATFFPESGSSYSSSLIRQGGTWVMTELILAGLRHLNPRFIQDEFYLDSAMIPEIIYHEFSHIALSKDLKLNLSTPVVEGMADYFAARISDHPIIAGGIVGFSNIRPKNANQTSAYQVEWEERIHSNADFVLSLLWGVHQELPLSGDFLVMNAAAHLASTRADIRHDLIRALLTACSKNCPNPLRDRMKLRALFEEKGF
jgi:hypothetical protein